MGRYVMSDLHGCYDKFIKMLELVQFNDNDKLYIIGDIFDRGDNPLGILDYVISHKNIQLIKGNHEQMFIDYYENEDKDLWYYNGGWSTYEQLLLKGYNYEVAVYKYLKKLPTVVVVDKFILVHGCLKFSDNYNDLVLDDFLNQEEDTCLWENNVGFEKQYKDYTIVSGHTPTMIIEKDINSIIKRTGTIYIDCGCVFNQANGRLACLNLDNMEEFYV